MCVPNVFPFLFHVNANFKTNPVHLIAIWGRIIFEGLTIVRLIDIIVSSSEYETSLQVKPAPYSGQMCPVCILKPYFFKVHLPSHLNLGPPNGLQVFRLKFVTHICMHISHSLHMLRQAHLTIRTTFGDDHANNTHTKFSVTAVQKEMFIYNIVMYNFFRYTRHGRRRYFNYFQSEKRVNSRDPEGT